jgi:hypothetical protein
MSGDELSAPRPAGAPRHSLTVSVLAAAAEHTDCTFSNLALAGRVNLEQLFGGTRYEPGTGADPLAIKRGRLFVGMRNPAAIEVFDSRTHRFIVSLRSVGLMDGLFYDALHHRIYASGGQGYAAVYQQSSPNRYLEIAKVPTGPNARTSLWVRQLDRYYVAVPAGDGRGARVLVFQPTP